MARRRTRNLLIAGLAVLALIGIGMARGGMSGDDAGFTVFSEGSGESRAESDSGEQALRGRAERQVAEDSAGGDEFEEAAVPAPPGVGVSGTGGSANGYATSGSGGDFASDGGGDADGGGTIPLPPLKDSERIIKDGRLEVEVPKGGFDQAFRALVELAGKAEGQVVSSQSSRDDKRASGEVTIRVPAQRFDQLLASTQGVGKVEHREVTSQDVSGEFVDLQARVRHLQAQEQFYLGLLGKAKVVGDAIAINQHLSTVQAEIEQVQGRLRLLDERSTYSRLTVSLYEPGVAPLLTDRMPEPQGRLGLAWSEALLAFQETIGALLVGAFTMAPLLLLGLLAWAAWRRLRPRPAASPDPRPAAEEEAGPLPVG